MNLASAKAALKCDIVRNKDNYKYLVTLYTHHFRERFTFSVLFFFSFLASLFLGNLRQDAQVFIHTRPHRQHAQDLTVKHFSELEISRAIIR